VQLIISITIALIFWVIRGNVAAYSSVMGGMIFTIPQLYFSVKAFLYMGARANQLIVQNFYKGESTKIILITIGFAVAFRFVNPLDHLALLISFFALVILNPLTVHLLNRGK